MPAFSHLDAGTPEAVWRGDPRTRHRPELRMDVDELIVVAAHPDDETLGAAGLIRRVHRRGGRVTVIVATDGEASHPASPTHTRAGARRAAPGRGGARGRRPRGRRAAALPRDPRRRPAREQRPPGRGRSQRSSTAARVAMTRARVLVVAPWSGDGHRDHRIAAEAVARVCEARGIRHLGYPIWLWHWGAPDDVPWESARDADADAGRDRGEAERHRPARLADRTAVAGGGR